MLCDDQMSQAQVSLLEGSLSSAAEATGTRGPRPWVGFLLDFCIRSCEAGGQPGVVVVTGSQSTQRCSAYFS